MLWLNLTLAILATAIVGYSLGSINFAIIITKVFTGKDIREFGSGNAGMTNVLRTVGKPAAALTLIGDFCKGIASVVMGRLFFDWFAVAEVASGNVWLGFLDGAYIGLVFALLGHLFPLYYNFKGGKGILVSGGAILFIDWRMFLTILAIFVIVVIITKIVSISSIAAAVGYPLAIFFWQTMDQNPAALPNALFGALIAAIVIWMHRQNIQRLINGTEHKFGKKKQA